MDSVRQNSEV